MSRSPRGERGLKLSFLHHLSKTILSLSSRRAWIEMSLFTTNSYYCSASLSSRRAWIEIITAAKQEYTEKSRSPRGERGLKYNITPLKINFCKVALLAESVDWNSIQLTISIILICRSPRGERGLKSAQNNQLRTFHQSLSSRRAWIEM